MEKYELSSGIEDYIEAIYIADINKTQLKGAQLARKLNISRASVSEALARLVKLGLVKYESYGNIKLTELGKKEAIKVYHKHSILKEFFSQILSVKEEDAEEFGCKIEHVISQNILQKIRQFTLYCNRHPEIVTEFNKENSI